MFYTYLHIKYATRNAFTSIGDILTQITAICVWLVKSIICLNYKQNLLVKLTFDIYSKDMLSEAF